MLNAMNIKANSDHVFSNGLAGKSIVIKGFNVVCSWTQHIGLFLLFQEFYPINVPEVIG